MRTTHTTCLRRRRGVSTILGTLIFIGILFTAVIPMFLVMKQADNIYTRNVHEMEIQDQDRASEAVEAYAYPLNDTSSQLNVRVSNTGVVPVNIVRVWINDVNYSASTSVASQDTEVIGPFTVTLQNGTSYLPTVTTERGNSFASSSGTLHFTDGYWFTPSLGIHILVLNWVGKYKVYVHNDTWNQYLTNTTYETQGIDFGDIECSQLVDVEGEYWVKVVKKVGANWVDLPSSPVPVVIVWPGGSPVINVIVDGRDT